MSSEKGGLLALAWTAAFLLLSLQPSWLENRVTGQALSWLEGTGPGLGRWASTTGDTLVFRGEVFVNSSPLAAVSAMPPAILARGLAAMIGEHNLPRINSASFERMVNIRGGADLPLGTLYLATIFGALFVTAPIFAWMAWAVSSGRRDIGVLFILGTPLLLAARYLSPAIPSVALTLAAALAAFGRHPRPFLGGLLIGLAALIHHAAVPLAAVIAAGAFFNSGRTPFLRCILGLFGPLFILAIFQTVITGSPFTLPHTLRADLVPVLVPYPRLDLLGELTFGSRRGLFVMAPIFLGVVAALVLRRRNLSPIEIIGGAGLIIQLLLNASMPNQWHSGAATISRYLLPVLPVAFISLARLGLPRATAWVLGSFAVVVNLWISTFGPLPADLSETVTDLFAKPFRFGRVLPAEWAVPVPFRMLGGLGVAALLALLCSAAVFVRSGASRVFRAMLALTLVLGACHHAIVLGWMTRYERVDDPGQPLILRAGETREIEVRGAREGAPVLISALANGLEIETGAVIATVMIEGEHGQVEAPIRAGHETAEWSLRTRKGAHGPAPKISLGFSTEDGFAYRFRMPVEIGRIQRIKLESKLGEWHIHAILIDRKPRLDTNQ